MGALIALTFRAIRGAYYLAYEQSQAPWVDQVATRYPTDQDYEDYRWINGAPALSRWTGERKRETPTDRAIRVLTEKWGSGLEFSNDDVQNDKTGQIMQVIQEMGAKAAELPERLLTERLIANGNGYDGAAFFATSHNHGGTCNNARTATATAPDVPTAAEMAAALTAAMVGMLEVTDSKNEPVNKGARQFLLLLPPKYLPMANAALKDQFLAAGQSNPLKSQDWSITLAVNPRLDGSAGASGRRIFLFRTDASIRSMILQEQDLGPRAFQMHGGEGTDLGFWQDGFAVGPMRKMGAGYGRFELATRIQFQ